MKPEEPFHVKPNEPPQYDDDKITMLETACLVLGVWVISGIAIWILLS